MADPASYRPAPGSIPEAPGVYKFRDDSGRVIYVGKAKSLRSRLSSYFQDVVNLHPRTQTMVQTASSVEWTTVSTEVEALQLEYNWIKEFDPRFNVRYRDDKSYPSLAVTLYEEYPRLQVMRGPRRKGVRYFGPYAHAWAIRETLDALVRVFPARTCSNGVFTRQRQLGRPCLLGYIDKCSAPCVGRVSADQHREIVDDFCAFMAGQTAPFIRRLEKEMHAAAGDLDFERAARMRDDIKALERAMEKQAVVLSRRCRCRRDRVRRGRARGGRTDLLRPGRPGPGPARLGRRPGQWEGEAEETLADLVELFLLQMYADDELGSGVPREVLVPVLPPEPEALTELLCELRGTRVELRVPQRGDKRALLETVQRNAQQSFQLHKLKRASDLSARSLALQEIQEALGLAEAPLRIECFDVSNLQGTEVVASMVVFEDGLARKSEYRRFAVRGLDGQDDVASMHQVVKRRFSRYLEEREKTGELGVSLEDADDPAPEPPEPPVGLDPTTGRPKKFAYPPNLVVVDGGPPQVAAAAAALRELGIDEVALVGLAKRLEEVWLPDNPDPVILPRTSEGLYLLQRVRDEAHRFAITYHRQRRSRDDDRERPRRCPGSRRCQAQGTAQAFRLAQAAEGCQRRGDRGAAGLRAAYSSVDRHCAGLGGHLAERRPDHG